MAVLGLVSKYSVFLILTCRANWQRQLFLNCDSIYNNVEPWWTSTFTGKQSERPTVNHMWQLVFACPIWTHVMSGSDTPWSCSSYQINRCWTWSKAFSRSRKVKCKSFPFSQCFSISMRTAKMGSVVQEPLTKLHWLVLIFTMSCRCWLMIHSKIFIMCDWRQN